jgi:hypothetical protein
MGRIRTDMEEKIRTSTGTTEATRLRRRGFDCLPEAQHVSAPLWPFFVE